MSFLSVVVLNTEWLVTSDYTKDEKTIVYNQCANEMLHYAVKFFNGFWEEEDHPCCIRTKAKVPPPPEPKSIDIIIAGFPW